jgi:SAM-dependent methyltransferase
MAEIVCPRDHTPLVREGAELGCESGHRYRVLHDVPVLLLDDLEPTHASCAPGSDAVVPEHAGDGVDPDVQELVAATCGQLYIHLIGSLTAYPIPQLRLPDGEGRTFLEVGCNWGRWCIAAARRGYRATGIDPSLRGVLAATRVAGQLDCDVQYVAGDARRLPFADGSFDVVFSYSVFQHFTREAAVASFAELGRVLKPGGTSMLQLANVWGLRSLVNQARERRFREPRELFDVRYWSPGELREELDSHIGPTRLVADGFFTLNPQPPDVKLMKRRYRAVVHVSEALRRASDRLPVLVNAADSIYAISRRS